MLWTILILIFLGLLFEKKLITLNFSISLLNNNFLINFYYSSDKRKNKTININIL